MRGYTGILGDLGICYDMQGFRGICGDMRGCFGRVVGGLGRYPGNFRFFEGFLEEKLSFGI